MSEITEAKLAELATKAKTARRKHYKRDGVTPCYCQQISVDADELATIVQELRVAQKALEIALHVQYDEPDVDSHAMKDGVKHWAIREARVALEVPE